MRKYFIVIALLISGVVQAQISFAEIMLHSTGGAYVGGGMDAALIPTIQNVIATGGGGYGARERGYKSHNGFVVGLMGKVGITPIRNEVFSYTVNADLNEAWLFNMSGSFRWVSHKFELGYKHVFFTYSPERVLKRYTFYQRDGVNATGFDEYSAHVRYYARRRNFGLKYLINPKTSSYIHVERINEYYRVSGFESAGYRIEGRHKGMIYAGEIIPKHMRRGAILTAPIIGDIKDTGTYFMVSIVKVIGFEGRYKNIGKKGEFFSTNYMSY